VGGRESRERGIQLSKGLGYLQRAILATLDDSKCRGDERYTGHLMPRYVGADEETRYHGRNLELLPDVYDMRASLQYLARSTGKVQTGLSLRRDTIVRANFASAFCRAVRGLVRDGYLEQWSSRVYRQTPAEVLSWPNRRLVRKTKISMTLIQSEAIQAIRSEMANKYDAYQGRETTLSAQRCNAFLIGHGLSDLISRG
jgi:hypothetical protein